MKKIYSLFLVSLVWLNGFSQNVGIGTTTPVARLHVKDSNVLFTGPVTLPATTNFNPALQGAGTRMMWYPQKGAFRAGTINGTQWDKDNIGNNSFAAGFNSKATGYYSIAMGDSAIATGNYSTAMGFFTTASAPASVAMGMNTVASAASSTALGEFTTASGGASTALGSYTTASQLYSTAMGIGSVASGYYSTAIGVFTNAAGTTSTSMGAFTIAAGDRSTSMGSYTTAEGHSSTSMGFYTKAKSPYSLVVGSYNDTIAYTSLFEIGNGTSDDLRKNAMTVLSNGNVGIGVTLPNYLLQTNYGSVRIEGQSAPGGTALSMGGHGDFSIDKSGIANGRLIVKENGFVGIGQANPTSLLHVGNGQVRIEGPSSGGGTSPALSMGGFGDIAVDKPGGSGGRFIVKENGNVGIGKPNPLLKLEVLLSPSGGNYHALASVGIENGATHYLNLLTSNSSETGIIFGNGMSSADGGVIYRPASGTDARSLYFRVGDATKMILSPNGNTWIAGNLSQSSDARLKKNIVPLSNTLSSIQQINGYIYNWKDESRDKEQQIGVIAQELQKVYPQLVKENSNGELSVNYIGLIPVLLEGMKEQQKQIEELKRVVNKLLNK